MYIFATVSKICGRVPYAKHVVISVMYALQISWIRLRDWHILTTGVLTYTSDSRFQVLHKEGSYDWVLQIKYVQERDAGEYDCQVRSTYRILAIIRRSQIEDPLE